MTIVIGFSSGEHLLVSPRRWVRTQPAHAWHMVKLLTISGYWSSDQRWSLRRWADGNCRSHRSRPRKIGIQRLRVDSFYNAPELISKLKTATLALIPVRNDGATLGSIWQSNFSDSVDCGLFFLFCRSSNIPGGPGQAMKTLAKLKARFKWKLRQVLNLMTLLASLI